MSNPQSVTVTALYMYACTTCRNYLEYIPCLPFLWYLCFVRDVCGIQGCIHWYTVSLGFSRHTSTSLSIFLFFSSSSASSCCLSFSPNPPPPPPSAPWVGLVLKNDGLAGIEKFYYRPIQRQQILEYILISFILIRIIPIINKLPLGTNLGSGITRFLGFLFHCRECDISQVIA